MNHTPGPWAIVDRDDALVIQTESPSKTKYGASRYACLSGFDRHDEKQYAEAKANARLIAAAPDLLEVLQELSDSAKYWSEYDVPVGIVDRIRQAIQKATGETP